MGEGGVVGCRLTKPSLWLGNQLMAWARKRGRMVSGMREWKPITLLSLAAFLARPFSWLGMIPAQPEPTAMIAWARRGLCCVRLSGPAGFVIVGEGQVS